MDHSAEAARVFDELADRYRDKYMHLELYEASYREFCELLPAGPARVLDAPCGPGNASRFLLQLRPDLDLLGIDLAPRMVELARAAVPAGRFAVHDCRRLLELRAGFDGILCAFGLPYLSPEEASAFIRAAAQVLEAKGVLYLSTMLGNPEDSGPQACSTGQQVHVCYHTEEQIDAWLSLCGLVVCKRRCLPSPNNASKPTSDLVIIARKGT